MTKLFVSVGECMMEFALVSGNDIYRRSFAGDTFNTAWTFRALTHLEEIEVRFVTRVGDDRASDDLFEFVKRAGIAAGSIQRAPGRSIGLYTISLDGHERSFSYWRDNSAARDLAGDASVLRSSLAGADIIYFTGVTLAILPPKDRSIFIDMLGLLRAKGATVAFDGNVRPALWEDHRTMRATTEAGYRAATIALPTYEDERRLFDDRSVEAAGDRLWGYGAKEVVIKNGSAPCYLMTAQYRGNIPAAPVADIVDTTGAGDSFNAGYLAGRMCGLSPEKAADLGHRVAARVIGSHGALIEHSKLHDLAPSPERAG